MKYTIFKPRKDVKGGAVSVKLVDGREGEPIIFLEFLKQTGWDSQNSRGIFAIKDNPDAKAVFAMNPTEAGEVLATFQNNIPFNTFHKSNSGSSSFSATCWNKTRKIKGRNGEEEFKVPSYGLSLFKNETNFQVPIEAGEAQVIARILNEYIIRAALHTHDVEQAKFGQGNSGNSGNQGRPSQDSGSNNDDDGEIPF